MTEICEHHRKLTMMKIHLNLLKIKNKNCHNDEHVWLNMTKNQIVFSRVQRVNVRRCHLSVMFKQLWFVSFGHIQTDFQLYQFGQVN